MDIGLARHNLRLGPKSNQSPILADFDFSAASPGGGSMAAFSPLIFVSNANANRTVRIGSATVASGGTIGNASTPRFGRADDSWEVGLNLENWTGNKNHDSRNISGATTQPGLLTVTALDAVNGPDGNALADRSTVTTPGYSRYFMGSMGAATLSTLSVWVRLVAGTQTCESSVSDLNAVSTAVVWSGTTTWQRVSGRVTPVLPLFRAGIVPFNAMGLTIPGANVDGYSDMAQIELGTIRHDVETTAGAVGTGWVEQLSHPSAVGVVQNGRLSAYIRFRAKEAYVDMTASAMYVWFSDANNWIRIDAATGLVTLMVAGVPLACATGITWAYGELVELWCECGGGILASVAKYRIDGGATITLSSGAPLVHGTFATAGTLDIGNRAAGEQLQAWHNRVTFYRYNTRPAWAA